MNQETKLATEIEEINGALAAFDTVSAGLALLKAEYGNVVYAVTTPDGMAAAKAARKAIRDPRYEVERVRKAAKAPLLALGKRLDSEAQRITAELRKIEDPIDIQIVTEEQRVEEERQRAIEAEQARVREHQVNLALIRAMPTRLISMPPAAARENLRQCVESFNQRDWQEFAEEARVALDSAAALAAQNIEIAERNEREAAALAEQRAELARRAAEQTEREEKARQDRAALEQLQAEVVAREQAMSKPADVSPATEAVKIEAEPPTVDGGYAEPAPAAVPPPAPDPVLPSRKELVIVIAQFYNVTQSVAEAWLVHRFNA